MTLMPKGLRRTGEKRNKMVWWPLSLTEKSANLVPFRLIAPLDEKLTTYLAKKLTFATPGPTWTVPEGLLALPGARHATHADDCHRPAPLLTDEERRDAANNL